LLVEKRGKMCWSETASLWMTIMGVVLCVVVWRRENRPGHHKIDVIIPLFYTIMEGYQYLLYKVGFETCDSLNTRVTFIGFYLIWFQPVLWNYWALKVSAENSKRLFACTTYMSLAAVFIGTIALIVGHNRDYNPTTEEFMLQLGPTCTYPSKNHFYWLFNLDSLGGFRPHWFTFLSLLCIPQLFRVNKDKHWWGPGWVATFVHLFGFFFGGWYFADIESFAATRSFYPAIFTNTIASGWCAFSVPSGIILPCFGKFYNNYITQNQTTSAPPINKKRK